MSDKRHEVLDLQEVLPVQPRALRVLELPRAGAGLGARRVRRALHFRPVFK